MGGETDLKKLIGSLECKLNDKLFVFITLGSKEIPESISPVMVFREEEGITLIATQDEAEACRLEYEFPCRMITLNIHSSLEAVGFMAKIATALAAHDMGVNPVAGFFHDHIFVPDGREKEAIDILEKLATESKT